ncbi:MAG TPA: PaaI family thioesterase [Nevskiaceae bacterium]|nr:PaaI family thioesterase [Nevskiaceae bacterium]
MEATAHGAVGGSVAGVPPGFEPIAVGGPFIASNGPLYLYHQGDDVRLGLRVEKRHTNPMGNLHGGMMASFCDMLMPLAVHARDERLRDHFLPTISLHIDYLAPAGEGAWLEGRAELLRATHSMVFARGLVTADGVLCVRANTVCKIGPTGFSLGLVASE